MGLDYSQKRLLSIARRGAGGKHGTLSHMTRKRGWAKNIEMYAFWTGFMSTLISLAQVILLALKK